jgi:hypothetical protein
MRQYATQSSQNFAIMGRIFSSTEIDKKKIEIGAVIDFCNANRLQAAKFTIFKFFEVPKRTGFRWFPGKSSPNFRRPSQPGDKPKTKISPVKKRAISEDTTEETSHQPSPAMRQNPIRNDGRDRKRLKSLMEDVTERSSPASSPPPLTSSSSSFASSSPPLEQPITSKKRKSVQPRKKNSSKAGRHVKFEEEIEIKGEDLIGGI